MAEHLGKVKAPVMIGVGAAFDFHAGLKKQAPRWMQRSGLEWFFRLATEPRRLWKRYLINNPLFAFLVFLQLTGLKSFQSTDSLMLRRFSVTFSLFSMVLDGILAGFALRISGPIRPLFVS